jgi:hypothetical protein
LLRTRGGCFPCTSWGLELELAKRAVHILAGDIGGTNAHLVLGEAAAAEPLVVVFVSMGTGARTGWFPKCIARRIRIRFTTRAVIPHSTVRQWSTHLCSAPRHAGPCRWQPNKFHKMRGLEPRWPRHRGGVRSRPRFHR